jgi:hypothetical protein
MAIVSATSSATATVTARTLILSALRKIRAISPEETPEPYQIQNGLEALNDLLSSWATERLLIYAVIQRTGSLVAGTASYTIGAGATLDLTRPQRIERAFVRVGDIDYPVEIIDRAAYMSIPDKTAQGMPQYLYYDTSYTQGKVYVFPTPDASYTLHMDSWEPLSEFASENTEYTFPLEYKLPLKSDLAILLAAEYGKEVDPDLREIARTSKGNIKRMNSRPLNTTPDYFTGNSRSRIETDNA